MIIEKPINVPQMSIEEKAELVRRIEHPDFKAMQEHWESKPSLPKNIDFDKWDESLK